MTVCWMMWHHTQKHCHGNNVSVQAFICIYADMNVLCLVWIFSKQISSFQSSYSDSWNVCTCNLHFVFGVHIAGLQASRIVTEKAYSNLKSSSLFKQCQFLKNSWRQEYYQNIQNLPQRPNWPTLTSSLLVETRAIYLLSRRSPGSLVICCAL